MYFQFLMKKFNRFQYIEHSKLIEYMNISNSNFHYKNEKFQ